MDPFNGGRGSELRLYIEGVYGGLVVPILHHDLSK